VNPSGQTRIQGGGAESSPRRSFGEKEPRLRMRQSTYFSVLAFAGAGLVMAQGAPDDGKLLTTFQNPVGNLISVPFQNNINFPIGEFSRIQNVLNIQPVIPIHVSEDWLVISRWIIPVVYQPDLGSAVQVALLFPSQR
jgi:hypothetical protein